MCLEMLLSGTSSNMLVSRSQAWLVQFFASCLHAYDFDLGLWNRIEEERWRWKWDWLVVWLFFRPSGECRDLTFKNLCYMHGMQHILLVRILRMKRMKAKHARRRMSSHAWMKVKRPVVSNRSQSVVHLLQVQADAFACMQMHTCMQELMHEI